MAVETGTATDYSDLLQKLKAFLTGTNSPSSGLTWQVVREKSYAVSPNDLIASGATIGNSNTIVTTAPQEEIIFRGNGGTSPETAFYVGIRTFERAVANVWSWEIRGFTGYSNTSPETGWFQQPNKSGACFTPLLNSSVTYWFVGNDRRVIVVVKTGTNYQQCSFGLLNTYGDRSEYPYPLYISGSAPYASYTYQSNPADQSCLPIPSGDGTASFLDPLVDYDPAEATMYVYFVDGLWYSVKNIYLNQGNGSLLAESTARAKLWPIVDSQVTGYNAANQPVLTEAIQFGADIYDQVPGGVPNFSLLQGLGSPPFTSLWPCICHMPTTSGGQFLGEIDGIYWCASYGGLTAEDNLFDSGESPEQEYKIFQITHRSDPWMFYALRWE